MAIKKYPVQGMHCAGCAVAIKGRLEKIPGIKNSEVNYASEEARIEFKDKELPIEKLNEEIRKLGYSLIDEGSKDSKAEKKENENLNKWSQAASWLAAINFLIIIYQLVADLFNWPTLQGNSFNIILAIAASLVLFGPGKMFIIALGRFFRHGVANMDTLVGLGSVSSYSYSLFFLLFPALRLRLNLPEHYYFDATIIVIGFVLLGKNLEKKAKKKSGNAIKELMSLRPETAYRLLDNGDSEEVESSQIKVGDKLLIKPGGVIAVDGRVISGDSSVDESMISGEAIPVDKKEGDWLSGGTINRQGALVMRAEKIGSETSLSRIIKMVSDAQDSRAPIQNLSDKISAVFVPVVLVIALLAFFIWLFFTPSISGPESFSLALTALIGTLVIACPCALGLATPTALMVGIGKGAKKGILIKNAESLEKLRQVDTIVLDKTGTITKGKIFFKAVRSLDPKYNEEEIIKLAASLEKLSEHPVAQAVVKEAKRRKLKLDNQVSAFLAESGQGVKGKINGKEISLHKALPRDQWDKEKIEQGENLIDIEIDKNIIGQISCGDEIKEEAAEAIASLKKMGKDIIMLTGDRSLVAAKIAQKVGIDKVKADVIPEDKTNIIKELQDKGKKVVMLGDGINDAPALAQANCGMAMSTGTDIALASADISLLHGNLNKAVQAIRLSKLTFKTVKENLFWAFAYNIIGVPLAAGAFYSIFHTLINPAFAGTAMAFSSVTVVLNSLRLGIRKI